MSTGFTPPVDAEYEVSVQTDHRTIAIKVVLPGGAAPVILNFPIGVARKLAGDLYYACDRAGWD